LPASACRGALHTQSVRGRFGGAAAGPALVDVEGGALPDDLNLAVIAVDHVDRGDDAVHHDAGLVAAVCTSQSRLRAQQICSPICSPRTAAVETARSRWERA
jgi:hypothetical protein